MGDLKYILSIAIFAVSWAMFLNLFLYDTLQETPLAQPEEDAGFLDSLKVSTGFLNPFSDLFRTDILLITALIFTPLLFGIAVVGLRFIRGQ